MAADFSFRSLYGGRAVLSLEFFPPKQAQALPATRQLMAQLSGLTPDFMTVTYGAGGGTRENTQSLVAYIVNELKVPAVAHLTCVNHSRWEVDEILAAFSAAGIRNILALRGDSPAGSGPFKAHPEGFSCARDLVAHIKSRGPFNVAVAGYPEGHPEAESREADVLYLKEKIAAGADLVLTQLFFDADYYFRFLDRCRAVGISAPVVPGLMPISNVKQLQRFTSLCGATIPAPIKQILEKIQAEPQAVLDFGSELAAQLGRQLLEGGAPGLHLYTLNQASQIERIVNQLRTESLL